MENMNELMEQAIETVGENVAESTNQITFAAPAVVDTMTDISTSVDAVEPHFGLKEGLTLGALLIGGGCVVYTGIDIFKKLKAKHEAKKAEKIAAAQEAEKLAQAEADINDIDEEEIDAEG